MKNDPGEAARLKEEIQEAFADVPYPGDDQLVTHTDYFERDAIKTFFKGKDWRDINIEWLSHEYPQDPSACLGFMTPQAFRYYLPAYLLVSIDNLPESDVTPETTVWALTAPETPGPDMDRFVARMDGLTKRQAQAIKSFLEFRKAEYADDPEHRNDPIIALERYWNKVE